MADTISVKLAGLSQRDSNEVFKPKDMMVVTLNLRIDSSVKKKRLKDLSKCQACDKIIQEVIRIMEQKQENARKNVMV